MRGQRGYVRNVGMLFDPAGAGVGDHVCFGYRSDDDYEAKVSAYCEAGVDGGHRVIFVSPLGGADPVLRRLADGLDLGCLIRRGALEVGSIDAAYRPGDSFDPDRRVAGYRVAIERALADGFSGLWVAADATPMVTTPGWAEYEWQADMLASTAPFTALCAYDRRRSDPVALAQTEAVHATSLSPGVGCSSIFFRVHASPTGGIAIAGEVDATVTARLEAMLTFATGLASAPVIDVSKLEFADARATRIIAHAAKELASEHGGAALVGASSLFRRIWEIAGFGRWAPQVELRP